MQNYEFIFVVTPELNDPDALSVSTKYQELINSNGGKVLNANLWGRKKLAYPINKKEFGIYFVIYFEAPTSFVKILSEKIAFDEIILRNMLIKCEDPQKEQKFFESLVENPKVYADLYLDLRKGGE